MFPNGGAVADGSGSSAAICRAPEPSEITGIEARPQVTDAASVATAITEMSQKARASGGTRVSGDQAARAPDSLARSVLRGTAVPADS